MICERCGDEHPREGWGMKATGKEIEEVARTTPFDIVAVEKAAALGLSYDDLLSVADAAASLNLDFFEVARRYQIVRFNKDSP